MHNWDAGTVNAVKLKARFFKSLDAVPLLVKRQLIAIVCSHYFLTHWFNLSLCDELIINQKQPLFKMLENVFNL